MHREKRFVEFDCHQRRTEYKELFPSMLSSMCPYFPHNELFVSSFGNGFFYSNWIAFDFSFEFLSVCMIKIYLYTLRFYDIYHSSFIIIRTCISCHWLIFINEMIVFITCSGLSNVKHSLVLYYTSDIL